MLVDIISVGSLTKPDFQDAQERTFGRHVAVRTFHKITEVDDADADCPQSLTMDDLHNVVHFCKHDAAPPHNPNDESAVKSDIRGKLFKPKNHTGWLCAQKRPIDGVYKVLQQYQKNGGRVAIPDYLFIIDDDTYLNMDSLVALLATNFPPSTPYVRTGCVFDFLRKSKFRFPFGGFGSFLSKASIERLLQPIDCNNDNDMDPFVQLACRRLLDNFMGEARYFSNGMNVVELMYEFATQQPFGNVANWTTDGGYCMHSDHALAYFFNYYHIAATTESLLNATQHLDYGTGSGNNDAATVLPDPTDVVLREYSIEAITNETVRSQRGECRHVRENCTVSHTVCHYIEPDQMDALEAVRRHHRAVDNASPAMTTGHLNLFETVYSNEFKADFDDEYLFDDDVVYSDFDSMEQ
jgi:hypothetical protein